MQIFETLKEHVELSEAENKALAVAQAERKRRVTERVIGGADAAEYVQRLKTVCDIVMAEEDRPGIIVTRKKDKIEKRIHATHLTTEGIVPTTASASVAVTRGEYSDGGDYHFAEASIHINGSRYGDELIFESPWNGEVKPENFVQQFSELVVMEDILRAVGMLPPIENEALIGA
ncbi:MAG: hypothetical protein JWO41_901 [Candidatus Saccharibacteria bacterium]|nr:hypothetical protein [Candidatus Saccharibacteria bacterium]